VKNAAFKDQCRVSRLSRQRPRRFFSVGNRNYVFHTYDAGTYAFHPKCLVAVGPDHAVAVIGSANLTQGGWMRNLELVDVFESRPGQPDPDGIVSRALGLFRRWLDKFPSRRFELLLHQSEALAPWLVQQQAQARQTALLTTLDGALLDQLAARIAADRIEHIDVLSPYFDSTPKVFDAIVDKLGPVSMRLLVAPRQGIPKGLAEWAHQRSVALTCCRTHAIGEHERFPHAKLLAFRGRTREWFAFGSANATAPALLANGNEELLILRSTERRSPGVIAALLDGVLRLEPVSVEALPAVDHDPLPPMTAYQVRIHDAERSG